MENNVKQPVIEFDDVKDQVDEFLNATMDARMLSERCRDYVDGKQWTETEIAKLKRRKQAPIVNNRIKVKYQGLLGLTIVRKTDPKAFPRNEKDGPAAEAVTDGLRYVADKTHFNNEVKPVVAGNLFCEGYGGGIVSVEQTKRGEVEVTIDEIPWDRIYFDPYSRKLDFSDARYMGFTLWMDEDDLLDMIPDVDPDNLAQTFSDHGDTFDDKPEWFVKDGRRKRYLIATHYCRKGKDWYVSVFCGSQFLIEPDIVPFVDEDGESVCPMELVSAYTDRENNRYGELAGLLDLQDEINHRRSKALFLLSQRQTYGNKGAVKDVKKIKQELAKPDGHVELGVGEFGKDFGVLPTGDMAQGQIELLQEAKAEIDAQSYNAQLAGQRQKGELSGIAIQRLQQSGMNEMNTIFQALTNWELRIYKQVWWRIKQFWTEEKWVRVTDDQNALRWVGFNTQYTMKDFLQETMDDEALPMEMRLGASAQMIMLEQQNPEGLQELVETKNQAAELDMDIILDQSFDTINIQQEQLDAILKFGAAQSFDIRDLIDISNITGKEDLIERIEKRKKEASEAQQGIMEMQQKIAEAKMAEAAANAKVKEADAQQTQIENQLLIQNPEVPFKGSVSA